jgi:Ca-activated chloride channel family protein
MSAINSTMPDTLGADTRGAFPARTVIMLWSAARVIGAVLLATIAILLLLALLFPGAIRAARAQGPATGAAAGAAAPTAGLFFRAGRADAVFEAPTLASEVEISVAGLVSRVTVRQHFINPARVWMEGIYVFPLPEHAAVDRLTMTVGGREIEGRILERAEARKAFEEAAAQGRRASLLSSERANVFTTSVANIGPGEVIVIEIEYQDRIAYADGRFSLRFPMVVAPRYTPPGVAPLAEAPSSRAQPAAVFQGEARDPFGPVRHPDAGPGNPVTLAVTLDPGLPLDSLESLYHPVAIARLDQRRRRITLAEGRTRADRDFVLEWRPKLGAAPEAAVFAEQRDGETFLTVLVVPPETDAEEVPDIPRDLIFVIDTSGSMHGPSIAQAAKALALALSRLGPSDRFNVIRFASGTDSLFRDVEEASPRNLRAAMAYLRALRAEGGTNMLPALLRALGGHPDPKRLRQVVFLTDGAVGNEAELFEAIAGLLGERRLFTIGIGSAPNSYFMRKAAELGRGSFTYIGDVAQVGARMGALLDKLARPALTGVTLAWPGDLPARAELYPDPIPDLYAGEPVSFSAKLPGLALNRLSGALTLRGRRGGEAWERRLELSGARAAPGVAAIWARAKIDHIEDGRYRREHPDEVRGKALAVALRHELVTRYTSLVAIDERPARPPESGLEVREIPRNLPAGWSWQHVFGTEQPPLKLRQLAPGLMRKINAVGQPGGQAIGLPQTATPAQLQALIGLGLLGLGLVLLLALRRGRRAGAAAA